MKIKRKSDGKVKDIPNDKADKFLASGDFEAVSDQSNSIADSSQSDVEPGYLDDAADLGRGVVQGGTLGFGDEIYGAGAATVDKASDLITGKDSGDWADLYRKYQESQQASNKESEDRSPWLYGGGQLAGGVVSGLLTAGAMPAAAAGGLRGALKVGGTEAAKYLLKEGAKGAAFGAVNAAGLSEGNLDTAENREKFAEDTGMGAAMGGVIAPAMSVVGAGISKAGDKIVEAGKENPSIAKFANAFKAGSEGKALGKTETGMKNAEEVISSNRSKVLNPIMNADEYFGETFGQVVEDATKKGVTVPINSTTNELLVGFNSLGANSQLIAADPDYRTLQKLVDRVINLKQSLTPREALELRDLAQTVGGKLDIPGAQKLTTKLYQSVTDDIAQAVPGFKEANGLIAGFRDAVPDELLLGKRLDSIHGDRENTLGKKVDTLLGGYRSGEKGALPSRETVSAIKEKLTALEAKSPGILEASGIGSVDDFVKNISEGSDQYNLVNKLLGGQGLFGQPSGLKNNAISELTAYGAGKIYGTSQLAGGLTRKANNMFNAPLDEVGQFAGKLSSSQNPMAQNVGKYLTDAVANKDDFKKNSALFIINQNPSLKAILGFGSEGDEN
jgi:hypothetical protein